MSTLSFFPWLEISQEYQFGKYRLIPYQLGDYNNYDFPEVIDSVLSPYKGSYNKQIQSVTLVECEGKSVIEEVDENERAQLFLLKELIAFDCLARRKYFCQTSNYVNADAFSLIIQKFNKENDGITLTLRKRDGYVLKYVGREGAFFSCPSHMQSPTEIGIDQLFVEALFKPSESDDLEKYQEAIFAYNRANSDNEQVMEQTELVLLSGAFERILECKSDAKDLSDKFYNLLQNFPENKKVSDSGRNLVKPKNNESIRKAWAYDFYQVRNDLAHGKHKVHYKKETQWSIKEHLLIATFLLPLVIKIKLSEYKLTEDDKANIHAIDYILAASDLFAEPQTRRDIWPWTQAIRESEEKINREELAKVISKVLEES